MLQPCDCEVCSPQIEFVAADFFGDTSDNLTEKEIILEDISIPQDINSNYQRDIFDCEPEPILAKPKKKLRQRQPVERNKLPNKSHARLMTRLNVLKRKSRH